MAAASAFKRGAFARDAVFSGTSRNAGGLTKLSAEGGGVKATPAYLERKLACSLGGVVLVGDHLYGTFRGKLTCADFARPCASSMKS